MVRHKVGLSFQLLLWERKVLLLPGFTFSEWGKRIQGNRLFLYSSALGTAMPGAELGSPGDQNVIALEVYGHSSPFLPFITTANSEP